MPSSAGKLFLHEDTFSISIVELNMPSFSPASRINASHGINDHASSIIITVRIGASTVNADNVTLIFLWLLLLVRLSNDRFCLLASSQC